MFYVSCGSGKLHLFSLQHRGRSLVTASSLEVWRMGHRLSESPEYLHFRSTVPLKKVAVASNEVWRVYDVGPRSSATAVLFLPPLASSSDVFFNQLLSLTNSHRLIAADWPSLYSVREWCRAFDSFLDLLHLERVHVFGAGLAGFLAQKAAERRPNRVASLILCNAFADTAVFKHEEKAAILWLLPSPMLRQLVRPGLEVVDGDENIVATSAFVSECLDAMDQAMLASRLTLNCSGCRVNEQKIDQDTPITIINVWDNTSLCDEVKVDLIDRYPRAKVCHVKSGGSFPFLSKKDEINMLIKIHLRNFDQGLP